MRYTKKGRFILLISLLVLMPQARVAGQASSSPSYQVRESGFSSGSAIDANSTSYSARVSAGDLAIGISESGSYITFAGPISPDEEYVELIVPVQTINLGVLEPGTPGTGTATFSARAYLDDRYIIVSPRDAPTSGQGRVFDSIPTAAAFSSSTEQFGINLVANTLPVVQGADPSLIPDLNFAYGEAAPGFETANLYQYNAGDIIARSITRGYGETEYTISYIMNAIPTTPAGEYIMEQDLVITATF